MREVLLRRLPLLAAGALAAAAIAVVLVLALERGHTASTALALQPGQRLAAAATLTPANHLFGDVVHARVDVVLDRKRLDPSRVTLDTSFVPYRTVRPPERLREDVGPVTRLRYVIDLRCVTLLCLPQLGSVRRSQFPPVTVSYSGPGPRVPAVVLAWPAVTDVSRLDPVDLEQRDPRLPPPWRVNASQVAPPTYGTAPSRAFWFLVAGAALLVGAATLLLLPFLPRPGFLFDRGPKLQPLERALAVVEAARASGPAEERKALELLAEELRRSGEGDLAWTASSLAWAPSAPDREPTAALAVDVRRVIDDHSNGHGH